MREDTVIYKGKEVLTLKQVPRRARDRRREYNFLTNQLNKLKIKFRWLIPEGLLISWEGRKFRIDSIEKAQDFIDQYLGNEGPQESKNSRTEFKLNDHELQTTNTDDKGQKKGRPEKEETTGISQRVTRNTTKQLQITDK